MSKKTKIYITFTAAVLASLLVPVFVQWYEQQTGKYPFTFCFVLAIGGFVSFFAAFTNDFKEM